jgi:hypothetical protein
MQETLVLRESAVPCQDFVAVFCFYSLESADERMLVERSPRRPLNP